MERDIKSAVDLRAVSGPRPECFGDGCAAEWGLS